MTHLRRENISRVWREVPKDTFTPTLFGGNTRIVSWCTKCKEHKPLNSFYLKELRDRKHPNDVRTMCIPCHDAQVERARVVKIIDSSSNLIEFFINEESDNYGTLFVGREVSSTDD